MSRVGPHCPVCAAPLPDAIGGVIVCGVCRTEIALTEPEPAPAPAPEPALRPVQSVAAALERRASIEPMLRALMDRYVEAMTAGERARAFTLMEATVYLTAWTAYECDDLDALAAYADPAAARAASSLGVAYQTPAERGAPLVWARVRALIA